MMIAAAACMIFSCRSHRDYVQDSIVVRDIDQASSLLTGIKQHTHEHQQRGLAIEWELNYTMLSEPDSAGRQHPTQTGTIAGKMKGESVTNAETDRQEESSIINKATIKEKSQQKKKEEKPRVEKASATPISLITLAIGLIITAVCVKWIVFKKGSKPKKR